MPAAEMAFLELADVGNNAFLRAPKCLFLREFETEPWQSLFYELIWAGTAVKDPEIISN